MRVQHIPCGAPVNESERTAIQYLCDRLQSTQGQDEWVVVTNHAFSVTPQVQSDEIDMILIGPPGIRVVEVKHWQPRWMDEHHSTVITEAERIMAKARKVGTTLRKRQPGLQYVDAVILITAEGPESKSLSGRTERGVPLYSLDDWRATGTGTGPSPGPRAQDRNGIGWNAVPVRGPGEPQSPVRTG